MLHDQLSAALRMQQAVATRHWFLNTAVNAQMMLASIMAYLSMALAVFAGANGVVGVGGPADACRRMLTHADVC